MYETADYMNITWNLLFNHILL